MDQSQTYRGANLHQSMLTYVSEHRQSIAWGLFFVALLWVAVQVKEVTTLLLFSYAFAILLDPLVDWLEAKKISRSVAIIAIGAAISALILLVIAVAVPAIIREYNELIQYLPSYLKKASQKISELMQSWLGVLPPLDLEEMVESMRDYIAALSGEQMKKIGATVLDTLLKGYSITLTLLNLALLPFFVYYITKDLDLIHRFMGRFLSDNLRGGVSTIGEEVLDHVYAFFRGQLTVSTIMAVLYAIGLSLVGLPSAIVVGFFAGFLNIVPYLGIAIGLVLATMISLVTDPSWTQLFLVWGVFVVVQGLEGTILTPKIVGESVGIHPLAVMVALIIFGKLFGLVGMIIAIPAAASLRVLMDHFLFEGEETIASNDESVELEAEPEAAG